MRVTLALLLLATAASGASAADRSAPSAYIPPASEKDIQSELYPIPQELVAAYLGELVQNQIFWNYKGENEKLQSDAFYEIDGHKMLRVGTGLTVNLGPEDLFQPPFTDGQYQVFLGAVTSADAEQIRLQVDLSALADDEEVWVIDPIGQRPFGPYTRADHTADGLWLPTIEGDTAVLMVRSARPDLPQVSVPQISHLFWSLNELKELSCNINIACETDADVQEISAAVGIMVVPNLGGDQALCSGTLINNSDTPAFEPYFITANHCVPALFGANQVDIVWDFRSSQCSANNTPPLSSLPRSAGQQVLATSESLDGTLMRLGNVPTGAYGRTYVGWSTSVPLIGDDCVVIHHPDGAHMRISYADVIGVDRDTPSLGHVDQVEVHYPSGVTEGGSSGSCLLSEKLDYAIIGMLSNGPNHSCSDPEGNTDRFASFRRFFNQTDAKLYLSGSAPPNGTDCPAQTALKNNPQALNSLRKARDNALSTNLVGREVVQAYYLAAPATTRIVREYPAVRAAVAMVAGACAQAVDALMP